MKFKKNSKYKLLFFLITFFLSISTVTNFAVKKNIENWYKTLNISLLTPPDITFGIAWTILYILIAVAGWRIWIKKPFTKLDLIKKIYIFQIILNLTWSIIFFYFHLIFLSFFSILLMILSNILIIILSDKKIKFIKVLLIPYLIWLVFAGYLNFYVFYYNYF